MLVKLIRDLYNSFKFVVNFLIVGLLPHLKIFVSYKDVGFAVAHVDSQLHFPPRMPCPRPPPAPDQK